MQESQQNSCIQPRKLANKNGEVRFKWPVSQLSRLCGLLYQDTGEVQVIITGSIDYQDRCLLKTVIKADLVLQCQTTFEGFRHSVDKSITICPVVAESQFAEVDDAYEPVLLDDGFLDIKQAVEDELILSLPLVANKPVEQIDQKMSFGELDEAKIAEEAQKSNPFSVLENLKKT
ncbi:YceD family protein [Aliikangiella maris]|uniref:Large ribosomal RNA subunit accumulation protein YceD n=2 Tax=Aliikangiella maris TaxID=3162458 RepID=A0ABV3ML61_9GAMM